MSEIFFVADTHFGHERIIELGPGRPFVSIEEHDEALVERWNAAVNPGDTVYHLGDVALRIDPVQAFVPRLNGHKILVAGNHDKCWTRRGKARYVRRAKEYIPAYLEAGFAEVVDSGQTTREIAGRTVRLSHLPSEGDHTGMDRYADRRPPVEGPPIICGHVHDEWLTKGRNVNVGVDQWDFAPVHVDQVFAIVGRIGEGA